MEFAGEEFSLLPGARGEKRPKDKNKTKDQKVYDKVNELCTCRALCHMAGVSWQSRLGEQTTPQALIAVAVQPVCFDV